MNRQQSLDIFQEITQLDDQALCTQILEENGWNVDQAVNNYMQGRTSSQTAEDRSNRNVNNRSRANQVARSDDSLFGMLMGPLRWLFQVRPISLNPELDTRKFLAEFELKYGLDHPRFSERSYQATAAEAFRSSKFLLVYIHSPMHEDTNRFCSQVLCSSTVKSFCDENVVFWAGRVWDPEAYSLSGQLRASTFPFLALLMCQSETVVQIADKVQGFQEENGLVERLQNAMNLFGSTLNRIRGEQARREEATLLREEQDREYREAAEADAREQRRRQEEREAAERAELERQQAAELQEAIELSNRLSHEQAVADARSSLGDEPAVGPDVATIRFQLPQGKKITRRFMRSDKLEVVEKFLMVHFSDTSSEVKNFSVSTHAQKQEDNQLTIEEVGLHPRGMLYVADLDA